MSRVGNFYGLQVGGTVKIASLPIIHIYENLIYSKEMLKIVWARIPAFSASNDLNRVESLVVLYGNPLRAFGGTS